MNKRYKGTISLYDWGAAFLMTSFMFMPFVGICLDYLGNFIVLSLTLLILRTLQNTSIRQRLIYCLIATVLGFAADIIYLVIRQAFTHEAFGFYVKVIYLLITQGFTSEDYRDFIDMAPRWLGSPNIAFALLPIPLVLIFLINWFLSSSYLKLKRKHALVMGLTMAIFTTPWVLALFHMT